MRCRIAVIAAMERELKPLIQGWALNTIRIGDRSLLCYERKDVVAIFCGMGRERAEQAARAVVEQYTPQILVSAGVAGALIRSLRPGSLVLPNVIVDAATGIEYRCELGGNVVGGGVLVTTFEIASTKSKAELVDCFHALVVDMEGAAIAKVAMESGLAFRCVKTISDEFDFLMPPLAPFVDYEGYFDEARFTRWVAVRPQYWPTVITLARNTAKAVRALCDWLDKNLGDNLQAAKVVTLNGAEYSKN
jgi:adenosylhomocysteine nucleosidase